MIRKIGFWISVSLLCLLSQPGAAVDFRNTSFKHISTEHGLSQKTIQTIWQDSTGFLWIGTQEGLNRYDGIQIRTFRHDANNKASLSHDLIRDVREDSQGNLWVATNGGLNRFIGASETFKHYQLKTESGESHLRINKIYAEDGGKIWIGTDGGGLFYSNKTENDFVFRQFTQIDALKSLDVRAVFRDSRGRLWVGTDGQGVYQLMGDKHTHFTHEAANPLSISHNRIRSITEDSKGQIWIGTRGGGLTRYNEISRNFDSFKHQPEDNLSLSHNRVYQVFEDSERRLWVGTDGGLNIFNRKDETFSRVVHRASQRSGLSHNRVLSIFEDQGGILWFGTLSGLNQWNPNTAVFGHYRNIIEEKVSLNNNTVYSLEERNSGEILIGTFGGGLNILDRKTGIVEPLSTKNGEQPTSARIMSLMVDREDNVWVGTISNGIEILNSKFESVEHFTNDPEDERSVSGNGITSIIQDKAGVVWVTTYGFGLNRFDSDKKQFERFKRAPQSNSPVNDNLFHVMEDSDGYLWIASDGGGISRFDKQENTFEHFIHHQDRADSLSGNSVLVIFEDSKGRFWIGTQGNGLNRWEPKNRRKGVDSFSHYSVQNGLNSSTVYGIIEDENGKLWISTTRGLNRLDPDTHSIEHFNLAEEIHHNELNQGAFLQASDGTLLFGGTNGVSVFHPNNIKKNNHVPKIALTRVSSENRPLHFEKSLQELNEVTFDHNDYLISFEFAALDFAQSGKNRYRYKLEGLYDEWIDLDNFNRATFTNLPSGSYILKVMGSNNDGMWSEDSINLRLTVLPAPWFSWWAFTLYAAGFCFILILMIRAQAKRLASQEVFQSQVSEKVAAKTALYTKNTDFLKAQLEQYKHRANLDLETGLAKQKYLYDLLGIMLAWINRGAGQSLKETFVVALFRLPEVSLPSDRRREVLNQTIRQFNHELNVDAAADKLLVRWSENDIGLLWLDQSENSPTQKHLLELYEQLKAVFEIVSEQSEQLSIHISWAKVPLGGVKQSFIDGEKLLMLVEHILHLTTSENGVQIVGFDKVNQLVNNTNFQQILNAARIDELDDVFNIIRDSPANQN